MKVELNGKMVTISDAEVEKQMRTLGIEKDEAIELVLMDNDLITDEAALEMTAKAKAAGTGAKATGERKARKAPERKPDELKRELIAAFAKSLETDIEQIASENNRTYKFDVTNIERMIAFEIGDEKFELTLTKKRAPKK